jgi:hypothetical protein
MLQCYPPLGTYLVIVSRGSQFDAAHVLADLSARPLSRVSSCVAVATTLAG